jgi:hypothetical protein
MTVTTLKVRPRALSQRIAAVSLITLAAAVAAMAQPKGSRFEPGNLVVSRSVYDNKASNVTVGELLPPGCAALPNVCATGSKAHPYASAPNNGTYPGVFNNNLYDGSFGITSKIFLDQITPFGWFINSLEVPNSSDPGITSTSDQMVTSFSSKSELALNRSLDGKYLTFMGYLAPLDALDVSNSNTPGASLTIPTVDSTNPVRGSYYRAVAQVDGSGAFHFTLTDAYSGNNGRAAILNNKSGANVIYTSGNAGNGSNPQPNGIIIGAGTQIMTPSTSPESSQAVADPTPVGSFNITELPANAKTDKIGKDTNFRGLTIFNNVIYLTKGSGGNGINTVYFIDTTGSACPNGVGLPASFAVLPTTGIAYTVANLQSKGVFPYNICILKGFPTELAACSPCATPVSYPFGLWFADANTLYVADEGDGTTTYDAATNRYTDAAAQTTAGLQKWVFDSITGQWNLAYTLQKGLNLGVPYAVSGYPTGNNPVTGLPWSPATDGLRNITGNVDGFGFVSIWGITSTVSGSGDQGADPNKLVVVTDYLKNTNAAFAAYEPFFTIRSAGNLEVLRGVSFAPESGSGEGGQGGNPGLQ